MVSATYLIKFMEILNIDLNCASMQMVSILSICDCNTVYNVFLSSLVELGFNKITFIIIRIVINALVRNLWPTLYYNSSHNMTLNGQSSTGVV